jgi:parvulin-like peptidyl-prolyl isomerase
MKKALITVALAAAIAMLGCDGQAGKGANLGGPVVASVNGDRLTKAELDSLAPEGFEFDRENLPKVLDKWVSNTLMYQEAVRRGIAKEPAVRTHLERLERDYLVNELLDRLTSSVKPDQAMLLEYYTQHKDEFTYEVKIMRIILPDSLMAVQTLSDLNAGADFVKLAKERSQDILLEAGQESKYFSRGVGDPRMGGDPGVEEAIFSLLPGQLTGVIASQEGYQIIKLVDRKKTKPEVTYAEAKDYIEAIVNYRQSQTLVDSVLTALRAKSKIERSPDAYFSAGR